MTLWILDTDHLSLYHRGNAKIRARLAQVPRQQIAIAAITAEELLRGRLHESERPSLKLNASRHTFGYVIRWTS